MAELALKFGFLKARFTVAPSFLPQQSVRSQVKGTQAPKVAVVDKEGEDKLRSLNRKIF